MVMYLRHLTHCASFSTGYGEINYRDRAMIVTILLGIICILRLVQIVAALAACKSKSSRPLMFAQPASAIHLHRARGETMVSRA